MQTWARSNGDMPLFETSAKDWQCEGYAFRSNSTGINTTIGSKGIEEHTIEIPNIPGILHRIKAFEQL